MKLKILMTVMLLQSGLLAGDNVQTGYVKIRCDADHLPIFIDGKRMGNTPLNDPILLPSGPHIVTCIEASSLTPLPQHYSGKAMKNIIESATQQFVILPGDTLEILYQGQALHLAILTAVSKHRLHQKLMIISSLTALITLTILFAT